MEIQDIDRAALRARRQELGLSFPALARRAGVCARTAQHVEYGTYVGKPETMRRVLVALGLVGMWRHGAAVLVVEPGDVAGVAP